MADRSFTVSFDGGKELLSALESLKPSLRKPVLRRAAMEALKPFLSEVKRLAPVAPVEGGALRDSYVIGGPTKLTPRAKGQARRLRDSEVEVYAGTSNPAGMLQEFGTYYQRAQPHARPAWVTTRGAVLKAFTVAVRFDIERTAARAAKRVARDR